MKHLKIFPIILLFALCFTITSCGQSDLNLPSSYNNSSKADTTVSDTDDEPIIDSYKTISEAIVEKHTFDDVAYNSYAFVFARCTGIDSNKDIETSYYFDTISHLAGSEMPKEFVVTIPVVSYYMPDSGAEYKSLQLEENHYYILPIYKKMSVFFDEFERYYLTSETLFETDIDGNVTFSSMQGEKINIGINNVDEFKALLDKTESICKQGSEDIGTKYSTANNLEGICYDSDYILEVDVIDINADFIEDRTSYDCRVLSKYKCIGDINEIIDVTTTKKAMEIGKKYIIAINRVSEGSELFVVSSRNRSVYLANSIEAKKMIDISNRIN